MKIYKKSENVFLILSIIIIILVLVCFYKKLNLAANFLLGLLASTLIVTLQSKINYKIETSKSMIPFIKKINEIIIHLSCKKDFLTNYYINGYNEEVKNLNNDISDLLYNLNVLNDLSSLKKGVKKNVSLLYEEVMRLVDGTSLIFEYYKDAKIVEKRYLYIELVKTLSNFDFELMHKYCVDLAYKIDFEEYISKSSFESTKNYLKEKVRKNPKTLFINKILDKNRVEYDTFKDQFELDEKYNIVFEKANKTKIKSVKDYKKSEK